MIMNILLNILNVNDNLNIIITKILNKLHIILCNNYINELKITLLDKNICVS